MFGPTWVQEEAKKAVVWECSCLSEKQISRRFTHLPRQFSLKIMKIRVGFFFSWVCCFFCHRNLRTQKKQPWEIFHRRFEKKMVKPPLHSAVTSRISPIDIDISTPKISANDGWVFPEMLLFQYLSDIIQMTPSIEEATHLWTEMLRRITWNH